MEDPYPRRRELSSANRRRIAAFDSLKHVMTRELFTLSEEAQQVFDPALLYDQPSYLGEYSEQLTPALSYNQVAAEALKQAIRDASTRLVRAQKDRDTFVEKLPERSRGMFTPVPDFSDARIVKQGNVPGKATYEPTKPEAGSYAHVEIIPSDEPMVSLLDYGINCRSYYSRPNGVTGDPVPGVKPDVFVRRSIAEKLVTLNELLKEPEVEEFFGGPVELFVDEGYRDPKIQEYLHDDYLPKHITQQLAKDKGIDLATAPKDQLSQLQKEVDTMVEKKSGVSSPFGEGTPGPHQTGAAVDMTIRYKQPTSDLVPRVNVWMGKDPANLVKVNDPDHFEHTLPISHEELVAQQNLRAWHYLLSVVGLRQNPTEFWHTGAGDQLSAILDGEVDKVTARYGWPAENPKTFVPVDMPEEATRHD